MQEVSLSLALPGRGLLHEWISVQPYELSITRTVIQEFLVAQKVYDISEKEKINQTKEAVRDHLLSNCQTDLWKLTDAEFFISFTLCCASFTRKNWILLAEEIVT